MPKIINKPHVILGVTTSRAEYGVLRRLFLAFENDSDIDFHLVVSGTHLVKSFGETINFIKEDKYENIYHLHTYQGDSEKEIINTMSNYLEQFGIIISKLNPDLMVIIGDRYELLPIASAATIYNIRIAHISGGDITEGAIDDNIRHAITKLSSIHFVSTDNSMKNVLQLGESENMVFSVGDLGIENIKKRDIVAKEIIEAMLEFKIDENTYIFIYHPETRNSETMEDLVEILKFFRANPEIRLIIIKSNADNKGEKFNELLSNFVLEDKDNYKLISSIDSVIFLNLLSYVNGIIGNSSSSIIEAPAIPTKVINIGNRQLNRECSKVVLHCKPNMHDLLKTYNYMKSEEYKVIIEETESIYKGDDTSEKILKIIKDNIKKIKITKEFKIRNWQ